MQPLQHAVVSVGLAAGLAVGGGGDVDDLGLYAAAIAGGEALDLLDHPINLVRRRREPYFREALRALRGGRLRGALRHLQSGEDARAFSGLLIHKPIGLLAIELVWLVLIVADAPAWAIVAGAAAAVHLVCDIASDYWMVGHARNWMNVFGSRRGLFVIWWGATWLLLGALVAASATRIADGQLPDAPTLAYAEVSAFLLAVLSAAGALAIAGRGRSGAVAHLTARQHRRLGAGLLLLVLALTVGLPIAADAVPSGRLLVMGSLIGALSVAVGTVAHTSAGQMGALAGTCAGVLACALTAEAGWTTPLSSSTQWGLLGAALIAVVVSLLGGVVLFGRRWLCALAFDLPPEPLDTAISSAKQHARAWGSDCEVIYSGATWEIEVADDVTATDAGRLHAIGRDVRRPRLEVVHGLMNGVPTPVPFAAALDDLMTNAVEERLEIVVEHGLGGTARILGTASLETSTKVFIDSRIGARTAELVGAGNFVEIRPASDASGPALWERPAVKRPADETLAGAAALLQGRTVRAWRASAAWRGVGTAAEISGAVGLVLLLTQIV